MRIKNYVYCLVVTSMLATACSRPTYNGEDLLLQWYDPSSKMTFRVTERPGVMVHTFTRLYVEREGHVDSKQIDDDARFGTISFVKYDNWLLVLSNDEVWAGYDYNASQIFGEHEYEQLPFTIRKSKGSIVARKWIHWGSASPSNFPIRPEPGG